MAWCYAIDLLLALQLVHVLWMQMLFQMNHFSQNEGPKQTSLPCQSPDNDLFAPPWEDNFHLM